MNKWVGNATRETVINLSVTNSYLSNLGGTAKISLSSQLVDEWAFFIQKKEE
ncbi:hypothetical protein LALCM10_40108 [Dellaglioa algida]|nr:hypothetical protein LALCM10_40108 [Dellaglioa algida]